MTVEALRPPAPPYRRLRVYSFDPSISFDLATAVINEVPVPVRWETDLLPGPIGAYLEVIDHDPATGCFYAPVDLNDSHVLAQDGLPPAEGNPQFHQQMVYAVAMTTIEHFEMALGRRALWASRRVENAEGEFVSEVPVEKLRIYPHALREANAYYSPAKKALLFGYFPAERADAPGNLPGGVVFTCLSHDIIAHETTHALLDGLHRRYNESTNVDLPAFHEAFADIVALFQHFSFPQAICHQVARTRSDLGNQNLLGQLAQQFGQSIGMHQALRSAIATKPTEPPKPLSDDMTEPHERGSILVAAVFDAFLSIYRNRVADLLRIATGGSGVLPQGELHPDLVNRLATEAAKAARHVLQMCIRALDYCPPVDLTFGEYLRALITADYDLVRDDDLQYRKAFIEAFRLRAIYPRDVRTLSVESLRWHTPTSGELDILFRKDDPPTNLLNQLSQEWRRDGKAKTIYQHNQDNGKVVHNWIQMNQRRSRREGFPMQKVGNLLGLDLRSSATRFEIHSVRPARRVGPDGQQKLDWIVEMTQRRLAWFDDKAQAKYAPGDGVKRSAEVASGARAERPPRPDFIFRGGSTLVIDGETGAVRYIVSKHVLSDGRLAREREYRSDSAAAFAAYFKSDEPFAMLHRL
jgi:hypothetical protein